MNDLPHAGIDKTSPSPVFLTAPGHLLPARETSHRRRRPPTRWDLSVSVGGLRLPKLGIGAEGEEEGGLEGGILTAIWSVMSTYHYRDSGAGRGRGGSSRSLLLFLPHMAIKTKRGLGLAERTAPSHG